MDFANCWLSGSDRKSRGSGHMWGPRSWDDGGGFSSEKGWLSYEEAEMRDGKGWWHKARDRAEFSRREKTTGSQKERRAKLSCSVNITRWQMSQEMSLCHHFCRCGRGRKRSLADRQPRWWIVLLELWLGYFPLSDTWSFCPRFLKLENDNNTCQKSLCSRDSQEKKMKEYGYKSPAQVPTH